MSYGRRNATSRPVCQFFLDGKCKFGDNCRNEHPGTSSNPLSALNGRSGNAERPYDISAEILKADLTFERPTWPLSCYGPGRNAPRELLGAELEQSPDEMRVLHYLASAQGKVQESIQKEASLAAAVNSQIQTVLSDVDGAIKFVTDGKDQHPNRIDMAKQPFGGQGDGGSKSSFGQPSQTTSAFGQPSQAPSAFGRPSQATSAFGQASQSISPFGRPSETTPAFGRPSQPTSAFGQPSQPVSSFGQPSAFGVSAQNPVQGTMGGQSSAAGTTGFGQPSNLGGFGKPSALGVTSAFGKPSFGQAGQPATMAPAFGQSGFGAAAQRPAFGQAGFGQPSALSPSTTQSTFGQPSAFGAAAANKASPFASSNAASGGTFGQPSAFGAAAGSTASPFAAQAAQQSSNTSPFAAVSQQQSSTSPFATAGPQQQSNASPFASGGTQQASASTFTTGGTQQPASAFGQPSTMPPVSNTTSSPFGSAPRTNTGFGAPSVFGALTTPSSSQQAQAQTTSKPPLMPVPSTNPLSAGTARQPTASAQVNGNVRSKNNAGQLVQFKGRSVQLDTETKTYTFQNINGKKERIWFPDGPPPPCLAAQAADAAYSGEMGNALANLYLHVQQTGTFENGRVPEIPPKVEWVSFDL